MANNTWLSALARGLSAERPAAPDSPSGISLRFEPDTEALLVWTGAAWVDVTQLLSRVLRLKPTVFADLPAEPEEGMVAYITDSSTDEDGAAVEGEGENKVLALFDGENWIVA